MDNTVTLQGSFVSTGASVYIPLRCGVDWFRVYNYTQSNFASAGNANTNIVQANWFFGMAPNDGFITINNAGGTANYQSTAAALTVGGFTFVDSSVQTPGPALAYTAGTNATPPVITVASTAGLSTGNIVRLLSSATAFNASGLDYTINVINGTTFSLINMIAPGAVFGAGTYSLITYNPIFYPRDRVISNITSAAQAVITTTVDHGYQVGQQVRLVIPPLFGAFNALNGLQATIVAVTQHTFTVNVSTLGFAAFAWPAVASVPFTPAQVVPIGEYVDSTIVTNPAYPITSPNQLSDATINTAFIGMLLAGGVQSPAGQADDKIYWQGGRVFNNNVQPIVLM
jgi:hypothetical protein